MNRKQIVWIITIAFFIGALGNIVLGRFVFPYLGSNVRILSFLSKLSSTSPIVVNRTEQVQLTEGVNLTDLVKQAGNTVVSIYDTRNNFLGNGLVVTSDGLIFTSDAILKGQTKVKVMTNDGKSFAGLARAKDPRSALVALTIEANNLPVAQFEDAGSMEAGQRVIYVGRSNAPFLHFAKTGFVTQNLANLKAKPSQLSTDVTVTSDLYGGPIVNLSGHVVGMVLGSQNIISEDLQAVLSTYLASGKITR